MTRNLIIVITVIVILGGLAWYLFGSKMTQPTGVYTEAPSPSAQTENPNPFDQAMESSDSSGVGVREFTITGSNFKFDTSEIKVKKGDTVRIRFINSGGMHDFVIDEFNVGTKPVNGPSEEVVEFVADKSGTFEFYCSVGQHRQMGMKGKITVE